MGLGTVVLCRTVGSVRGREWPAWAELPNRNLVFTVNTRRAQWNSGAFPGGEGGHRKANAVEGRGGGRRNLVVPPFP